MTLRGRMNPKDWAHRWKILMKWSSSDRGFRYLSKADKELVRAFESRKW